jgi:site-specific recombinase XerD
MPLAGDAPRRPCPATTKDALHGTSVCGIRLTRRVSRRSSLSCELPARGLRGLRLRALLVILWRAGLRISEALALAETDLDSRAGSIVVRRGKGGKRRVVGMDTWAWEQLTPWLERRQLMPVGALFCVIHGPTCGRPWSAASVRAQLRCLARSAGVRRRCAPHQLRHAHAVEMAREGVPLIVIQRQLGHTNLGVTSIYLQGIDSAEIIETVHARRPPMGTRACPEK